jgi:tripartite-type tricarboxylate transporter receptor subunit TctC
MQTMARKSGIGISYFALILTASNVTDAVSQKFPTRPIRFISPSPPGATVDLLTRAVGQKLSEQLGGRA